MGLLEGSLGVKLPTHGNMQQQRWLESEKRKEEGRRSEKRQEEDPGARKSRKSWSTVVFPLFCGSGGSKIRLLKQRVLSHLVGLESKTCTPVCCEAQWQKHLSVGALLEVDMRPVEKVHAAVAGSMFQSQTGAKHLSSGALLVVEVFFQGRCQLHHLVLWYFWR